MKAIIFLALLMLTVQMVPAQEWNTPIIEGYGKVKDFKDVALQANTDLNYTLVFDVKDDREMEGINIGFFKIARMINLLGIGGVSPEKVHIVAAIHGGATYAALSDTKYLEKNNMPNPNTRVIQLLKDYGVELYVCAQATAARDITEDDLNLNTQMSLSAMMVLANYQLKGYVLIP